ncbi:hypothetical protein MCOO_33130 [Mycobacterium cookii]|uniref:Uncharacterized protein n=1 Tax=Mycobacterium cookii TaxID=1775 RepID=A0A7I7L0M1_9MYCO|nr:hypothetical protein MCOO_33130 [Mycobacterium cookii]
MELAQRVGIPLERRKRGKRLGDLVLGIAMLGQRALHACYYAAGFVGPKLLAAHRNPHVTHLSWTTWRAGSIAAADIGD